MNIRPVDPESYDAYLKGRFHWYKLSPQNFQQALAYFSLALEKDPECALAHTGIANAWMAMGYWGITPPNESMPKAKSSALEAIEMDDTLEEAHDALARILYIYDWDWQGAEEEFRKAIKCNPNKADVHLFYSALLRSIGRGNEAILEAELGLELDPLNYFSQCHYIGQLMYMHQFDEAIEKLNKIIDLEPDYSFAHRYLWICYHQKQNYDDAVKAAKNYFSSLGKSELTESIDYGYANFDYQNAMKLAAKKLEEELKVSYIQPIWIARLYAYAGDKNRALDWLERAFENRDPLMSNLGTSLDWEVLYKEERFMKLLRQMNFPQ
jgi:tetratricopeptide (TPR) repeat protein